MTRQTILVTGGAGYIGSHAVKRLLAAGHAVVVLDDLSHGHRAAVDSRATFHQACTRDRAAVRAVLERHKIDAVMHFAAFIEVGESVQNPAKYYDNNFANGLALLDAMTAAGVKRLIFSSTAAVYGNPEYTPIDEEHPRAPVNPYGRTKNMMELALADYASAYGLGYAALRYFNVAGASPDLDVGEAHEPESHLIPRILAVAAGKAAGITVYGTDYPTPDGTCIRDYIHVEDLVAAHLLALEKVRPGGGGHAYNIGTGHGFTVRQVIDACRQVTGHPLPVEELPRRAGDPAVLVATCDKLKRELGWQPRYPKLETAVKHAWDWHRSHPRGFD
jgi:UDP-glucose-4-epimerase GalE